MASIQPVKGGEKQEIVRNLANFAPDKWGDLFTSFILDDEVMEAYNSEVGVLKERVRNTLLAAAATCSIADQMSLINTVERLGLSYHFEHHIEQQVEQMFIHYEKHNYLEDCHDLFTVSLHFRIFRQHGHKMSTNVFIGKFTDENGKFKESISNDITGMLSLYEAAHLRINGEDILEEALSFTRKRLSDDKLIGGDPIIADQVKHALVQPLHRGMPRLEAKYYISVYQKLETKNQELLRLAILDFNRMQLIYKQEIGDVTRWWRDVRSAAEVSQVRDRPVEAYFYCAGIFDAQEYSLARVMLFKFFYVMTIIDDIYDAYGTYEELLPFTEAWLRWDDEAVDLLPEYMKPIYGTIRNIFADLKSELAQGGRSYAAHYAIEEVKIVVRSYAVENEWLKEEYVPGFNEYLENAIGNSSHSLHVATLLGMEEHGTIEALEWVSRKPKITITSSLIARLLDDIGGHKERKHVASGIDCYMKEYGVSEEEARGEMQEMVEKKWKEFNEEMLKPIPASKHLLAPIINMLRDVTIIYRFQTDGFTKPETTKHLIQALYVDPFPT